jgi:hypothetical protein
MTETHMAFTAKTAAGHGGSLGTPVRTNIEHSTQNSGETKNEKNG